jgi:predicted exporter
LTRGGFLALVWAIVVAALLLHNGYLWLVERHMLDTDILALLPDSERDPALRQAFAPILKSAQQRLIALIGDDDWKQATKAADAYEAVLAPHAELLRFDPADNFASARDDMMKSLQPHQLLLITPQQESDVREQNKQFWVDRALNNLYSPFSGINPVPWQDDPFGLFGSWVQLRLQETPVRPRDGRLFVAEGLRQYVVLPMTVRAPAFSIAAQRTLMPFIERARQAAFRAAPGAEVAMAGIFLHAAAATAQANWEVSTIGCGSIAGILLLMWLTLHSFKSIALILLSVAIGYLGAFSLCWLLFERIHLLTLVFGASLIGVAQDYGLYFLCNRFAEDGTVDSWRLLRRLLPALSFTLITTLIGYFALALTPFPGLRQMAVFSVGGLIFAWLTVIFWFPVLARSGTLTHFAFGEHYAARLWRWVRPRFAHRRFLLLMLFSVLALFGLSRLTVQDDIRLLQNSPKNLLDEQVKVGRLLNAPSPAQFYLIRGKTAEEVLEREEALKRRLDPLVAKGLMRGYQAFSEWVPSYRIQSRRRKLVEEKLYGDRGPLAMLATRLGEGPHWVISVRERLSTMTQPLTPDDFLSMPASGPLRHLWLGKVGDDYASIVSLRGLGQASVPALQQATQGLPGVQWVDTVGEISALLGRYRRSIGWVVLIAHVLVFALLFPRYRRATWRILAPTSAASILALALLGAAGQGLQLFHVLALMLVLGIGVDYGIFWQEHAARHDRIAWLSVSLSASSTLLSFGLLGLSQTPALRAFGLTMLIGIVIVWIVVPCVGPEQANDPGDPAGVAIERG